MTCWLLFGGISARLLRCDDRRAIRMRRVHHNRVGYSTGAATRAREETHSHSAVAQIAAEKPCAHRQHDEQRDPSENNRDEPTRAAELAYPQHRVLLEALAIEIFARLTHRTQRSLRSRHRLGLLLRGAAALLAGLGAILTALRLEARTTLPVTEVFIVQAEMRAACRMRMRATCRASVWAARRARARARMRVRTAVVVRAVVFAAASGMAAVRAAMAIGAEFAQVQVIQIIELFTSEFHNFRQHLFIFSVIHHLYSSIDQWHRLQRRFVRNSFRCSV